ncbi:MAG: hypothetical protein H6645_00885 [Caldilineaceae bacterium]|nr:hypothetical protein [Caldilineaceae bacterium]
MTIQPFTDSHDLLPSAADLHTQMKQDGYLFISGLIPHAQIDQVYSAIMQVCRQEDGWTPVIGRRGTPWWKVTKRSGPFTIRCKS